MNELPTTLPNEAPRDQIEAAAVRWRALREKRLQYQKAVDELETEEKKFKQWVISALTTQSIDGVVVEGRITQATKKDVPTVTDREALSKHILETGDLSLLQFRLATTAVQERIDAGMKPPGVGTIPVFDLSDRKATP